MNLFCYKTKPPLELGSTNLVIELSTIPKE